MPDVEEWSVLGGGLMGNHQISDELLWASTGEVRLVPFTKDFGFGFKKQAGDTVTMYHVLPIPDLKDATLQEEGEVPVRMLSFGKRALTVTEHGSAITFTHKLELLFKFNPDAIFREALTLHLAETMDNESAALGFLSSDVKIVATPTSLTGLTFGVNGAPVAAATAPMTKDHIKKISTYMWDTIHVPFYNRPKKKSIGNPPAEGGGNDHYVCLSAGSNIENLLLDPEVARWQQAMSKGDMLYRNEQCNLFNIRFVRINRQNAFGDDTGTSSLIGDAVFFGDQGVARIEAETPSLRMNPNWGGRGGLIHAMLWYGVYTFGPVWNYNSDGLAKMIRWGSL
jgi:N4-gp56 family major capsid protein